MFVAAPPNIGGGTPCTRDHGYWLAQLSEQVDSDLSYLRSDEAKDVLVGQDAGFDWAAPDEVAVK
jgi:hypothetical protein